MNTERIRELLGQHGYSLSRIAKLLDVQPSYVSLVVARKRRNHRVAIAIATAIERPVDSVFPDVPLYHGPLTTAEQRDAELARRLQSQGVIRRSA
ncbi:XRE family transcriptional regulator [Pseudohongiella sp.]|uniref:HTH cro/C1-type domain-containing protein n=1 Tax=marine sediment metagenome TaxID=412755 RepID=A0A0F9VP15_9ZZZZ|nr:XRE family transcriptional regulator [Pseudohongiella sp.]HDZ10047.1 XRE family transcriptional regulator [Pseudohongiella sp.]HEA63396.1 XRE family transcriptional regulator [Pseudohongiella sp.]